MKSLLFASFCIALVTWRIYLSKRVDIRSKYNCSCVVVTGATGGVGKALVSELSKSVDVIIVGRNAEELNLVKQNNASKFRIRSFVFDFKENLSEFAAAFDAFCSQNIVNKQDIGAVFSNAGHGDLAKFESTSAQCKEAFMSVNYASHMIVADYFAKLFLTRQSRRKGAIFFTSSLASFVPGPFTNLYHVAKAAVSALGSALFAEYRSVGIDVLTVNPCHISGTKFYDHAGMKTQTGKALLDGNTIGAVTPTQVVNQMLSRIGKVPHSNVGFITKFVAFICLPGRNFSAFLASLITLSKTRSLIK